MATATLKTILPKDPPIEITLKLNKEEAIVLFALVGNIAKNGELRQVADEIYSSLEDIIVVTEEGAALNGKIFKSDGAFECGHLKI